MPSKNTKVSDKEMLVPGCTLGKDGRFRNASFCGKGECEFCGWFTKEAERRKRLMKDGHSFRPDAYGTRRLYLGLKVTVRKS